LENRKCLNDFEKKRKSFKDFEKKNKKLKLKNVKFLISQQGNEARQFYCVGQNGDHVNGCKSWFSDETVYGGGKWKAKEPSDKKYKTFSKNNIQGTQNFNFLVKFIFLLTRFSFS